MSAPPGAVSRETGPARRLAARMEALGVVLELEAAGRLVALLDRLAVEPQNLTAIEGLEEGIDRHLADSLVALSLPEVASAPDLVDIGSGAGFPGLALAIARPGLAVTLVESEGRKADWLRRAAGAAVNVRVVADRSEHLARAERERFALATTRAVGSMAVALELAAPLVAVGGAVVLWRGDEPGAETEGLRAAAELGLTPRDPRPVEPFPGARRRLQLFVKGEPTPARFPRRAGRAAKRPLGERR